VEPEHGRLCIYDTDDQQTVAFTPDGMEYLREMLPEYKQAIISAVLSGRLRITQRLISCIHDCFQLVFSNTELVKALYQTAEHNDRSDRIPEKSLLPEFHEDLSQSH
jgi:hypothetical protein